MRDTIEYDVGEMEDPNLNKGVYARFYFKPVKDEAKSAEEGRPVFVDKVYVEIIAAGNANNIIRRPASQMDIARFRKQHEMFMQGDEHQMIGTPLAEVPWITRSQVEEFAYRKIRTLEELANMSDAACDAPGMYDMKRRAADWIKKAEEAAPFTAMQAEMDKLRAELEAMKSVKLKEPKAAG